VSAELIESTVAMIREIERDPSLAHMVQNYARSTHTKPQGKNRSKGQEVATFSPKDAASWVQLVDLGARAPRSESLPLLLLAVKVAFCQCATEDGAKVKVPGAAAAIARLAASSGALVPTPATIAKRAYSLLRKRQATLLLSSPGLLSVGGSAPDLVQLVGGGHFTVAARSQGFVLMAPSCVKHQASDGDGNLSFTITVSAAGAFQAGWMAAGSDASHQESEDLRSNPNCCVCDGANVWSGGEQVQPLSGVEESGGTHKRWAEGDMLTCTLDVSMRCARFHRSSSQGSRGSNSSISSDITLTVPLPDAAVLDCWRPVVSSPQCPDLGAVYPAVWKSQNFAAPRLDSSPAAATSAATTVSTTTSTTPAVRSAAGAWAFRSLLPKEPSVVGPAHKLPRRGSVVGSWPLRTGIHRWQLKVHPNGGELRVGVVSEDATLNHQASSNSSSSSIEGAAKHYCLWHKAPDANRILVAGRRRKRESGLLSVKDDIVWVELNVDQRTVTFGTGASGLLVATTSDLPSVGGWLPCVQFSAGGSVELLSQSSCCEQESSRRPDVVIDGLVHALKGSAALGSSNKTDKVNGGGDASSNTASSLGSSAFEAIVPEAVSGGGWSFALWVRPSPEQRPTDSAWLALALRGSDLEERRCPGLFVASNDLRVTACVSTASNWNTSLPASRPLMPQRWTHVAVVCSQGALELYLDGRCDQRLELAGPEQEPLGAGGPLYLGQCPSGVKRPSADYPNIEGHLADAVYAPRVLTAREVAALAEQRPALGLSIDLSAMQPHVNNRLRLTPSSHATLSSTSMSGQSNDSVVSAAATAARGFTIETLVVVRTLSAPKNLLYAQGSPEGGGIALGVTSSGALYLDSFKDLGSCLSDVGVVSPGHLLHLAWVLEPVDKSTGSSGSASGPHHQVRFLVNGYEMVTHGSVSSVAVAPFAPGPQLGGSKARPNENGWDGEVLYLRVWGKARSELQVRACMTRKGPPADEAEAPLPEVEVPTPTCPSEGHLMTVTDGRCSRGYKGFECNQCHEISEKPRWWCSQCRDDFCFACRPGPTNDGNVLVASTSGSSTSSRKKDARASCALSHWWRCDEGYGNCLYDAGSAGVGEGSTLQLVGSSHSWAHDALPGISAEKEETSTPEPGPMPLDNATAGKAAAVPQQLAKLSKDLSVELSSEDSSGDVLSVRAAAVALLQTLAQSATSFLTAFRVESLGRGLGMHTLRAPRASLNPLVTSFKLIGSLLQHLMARSPLGLAASSPSAQPPLVSTCFLAIIDILTANLHAHVKSTGSLKELKLGKPSKAGLGAGTLCEQLLATVMALTGWIPSTTGSGSTGTSGAADKKAAGGGEDGQDNDVGSAVRSAAAQALCAGLSIFYPMPRATRSLMLDLLDGVIDDNDGKKKKHPELLSALSSKLCGAPSKAAAMLLTTTTAVAGVSMMTSNTSATVESTLKEEDEEGEEGEEEGSDTSLGGDTLAEDNGERKRGSSLDPLMHRLLQHVRRGGQDALGSSRLLLVLQDVLAEVGHTGGSNNDQNVTSAVGLPQASCQTPSSLPRGTTPILSAIAAYSDAGTSTLQSEGSEKAGAATSGPSGQVALSLRSERLGRFIGEEVSSGAAVHVGPMEGWTTAMADTHFTANSGRQVCSFQLLKTSHNDGLIFLGFGDASLIDPNGFLGACKHSFGWLLKGETYHHNSRISRIHASPFTEGTTLTIVAETDDGSASLRFRNEATGEEWQDRDMDHLFARALSRGDCFSPGVTLYHPGQCVLLTRESTNASSSSSSPLTAPKAAGASAVTLEEVPSGRFTPAMAMYGVELLRLALDSSNREGFHGRIFKGSSCSSSNDVSSAKSRKEEHFPVFLTLLKAWAARVAPIPILEVPPPLEGAGPNSLLAVVNKALHEADAVRVQLVDKQSFEQVPELEELQALLALVGGRLAAQMVNGESSSSSSSGKGKGHVVATSTVVMGTSSTGETNDGNGGNGDSEGLLEAGRADEGAELSAFLLEVCAGTGLGLQLSAFVQKRIGANSFKRLAAQGPELAAALRRFHAAALHHAGLSGTASALATRVSQCKTDEELVEVDPGAVLRRVWEKELELRMWCRHLKTSSGGNYLTLAAALDDKAAFLLELLPRCGDGDCSEAQRLSILDEVVRFLKRKEVSVPKLRARIAASIARAAECQQGLDACKELLRFDELPVAAKAAALSTFLFFRSTSTEEASSSATSSSLSPRSPSSTSSPLPGRAKHQGSAYHYSEGLSLSGWNTRLAVKASMESLFLRLGKELEYALECADLELQLVVLSCWGIALRPEDHALLLSARLFDSLMACLQQDEEEYPTNPHRLALVKRAALKLVVLLATQVATQGEIGAPQPTKAAAHAAMPPPMLPVAFKRQVSGTGTFTESIFNLLFEELSAGLGRLKKKTFAAKNNNVKANNQSFATKKATDAVSPETLDEILTLLGSIGTTNMCARVLGASGWLSLLLEIAHYAPNDATAAASFTLVSDLLPMAQPHRLGDLKLPPLPRTDSSNPGSPTSGGSIGGGVSQRHVSGTTKQAELVYSSPRRSLQSLAPPQVLRSPPLSPTNEANYCGRCLVDYLLHVAGLGLLPMGPLSSPSAPLALKAESSHDHGPFLPPSGLWLAHAAVSLLQKLLAEATSMTSSEWAPIVGEVLESALAMPLPSPWASTEVLSNFSRRRLAALAVLNGSSGRLQEGSLVTFSTHTTADSSKHIPTNRHQYRITAIGRTTATLRLAQNTGASSSAEKHTNAALAHLDLEPPPPLPWAHSVLARLAPLVDADLAQTLDAADHIIDLTVAANASVVRAADEPASSKKGQVVETVASSTCAHNAEDAVLGEGRHPFHEHALKPCARHSGWSCDGRKAPGGCRGTGGGSGARWRCADGCDYDLCAACWHQVRAAVARNTLDVRISSGARLAVQPKWTVEAAKRALQQCTELPEPLAWVENLRLVSPRPSISPQQQQSSSSSSSGPWHELSEEGGGSLASQVVEPDAVLWAVLAPSRAQDAAFACLLRRSACLKAAASRATSRSSTSQCLPYRGATLASLLQRAGRGSMAAGLAELPAFEAKQQVLVERWYALQSKRRAAVAAEAAAAAAAQEAPLADGPTNAGNQAIDASKDVDEVTQLSAAAASTVPSPGVSTAAPKQSSWQRLSLDFSQCSAQSAEMVAGMGQLSEETSVFLGRLLNYLLNMLVSSAWQEVRRQGGAESSGGLLTYEMAIGAVQDVFETSNMDELLSMAMDSMAVRRLQGWEEDQSAWAVASGILRGLLDSEAGVPGVAAGVDEAVAAAFLTCVEVVCVDTFELSVDACEDGDVSSLTPDMIREALADNDSRIADLINEMEDAQASPDAREHAPPHQILPSSMSASSLENSAASSSLGDAAAAAAAAEVATASAAEAVAAAEAAEAAVAVAAAMEELSELGLPSAWCEKALAVTGPNVEAALAYILENEQSLEETVNTANEVRDTNIQGASQASGAEIPSRDGAFAREVPEFGEHPWHIPGHLLELSDRSTGWSCDGRRAPGGCRGNGGGSGQARYRCCDRMCDYDLCGACWQVISESNDDLTTEYTGALASAGTKAEEKGSADVMTGTPREEASNQSAVLKGNGRVK